MQNAIETGRLIRDKVNISMKYPLRAVQLVDGDESVLEGFKTLEKYIKEELNCVELSLQKQEDDFVVYTATPDNLLMGKAFKKQFDKKLKAQIAQLSSDQIRDYLKNGKTTVSGLEITEGMLKINKEFNDALKKDSKWAVHSSMMSSVMLDTVQDEDLLHQGLGREITNRIQRLRKTSGISIEDQIEIFYSFAGESSEQSVLGRVISAHGDKIAKHTKMAFVPGSVRQSHAIHIGDTEFIMPENESEHVKISICLATPNFVDSALTAFVDGTTTAADIKSFVLQHDSTTLANLVAANGGLKFKLNGKEINLKHKEHFFFNANDLLANKQ